MSFNYKNCFVAALFVIIAFMFLFGLIEWTMFCASLTNWSYWGLLLCYSPLVLIVLVLAGFEKNVGKL